MCHIKAGVMTANTRLDIFFSVFHQFCNPCGIGKKLSCKSDSVNFIFFNSARSLLRSHSAGTNNRYVDKLFYVFHIFKVTVLRHISGRMSPIPSIICTVVAVEHIITCVLQVFCGTLRFFHISADFRILFAGQCTLAEALGL